MKLILTTLVVASAVVLLMISGCGPKSGDFRQGDVPIVRVRLLAGVDRVSLTFDQPPMIGVDNGKSRKRLGVQPGQTVAITLAGTEWLINGTNAGSGVMQFDPSVDASISVNGAPYRGSVRLVQVGNGRFDLVNDVDVESYLRGVLAKELFADWHVEAYKAQAVIARTYALYEVRTGASGRHWDLNPDERSQVYGGVRAETTKSTLAVDQTRGVVAAWGPTGEERIFKAYFSSCCGGVSASAADAFNDPAIPPLEAKYNGNSCSISPRYNWGAISIPKSELTRRLRAWAAAKGVPMQNLTGVASIEISMTNQFGRPRQFHVLDANGQAYPIPAEQLRWAINANANGGPTVFSSFFRTVDSGDSIQFIEGHGFGHGVGACQWCMQARATAGESFEQIVGKSFPQAKVLRAY